MAISKMYNKMKIDLQNTTHKNKIGQHEPPRKTWINVYAPEGFAYLQINKVKSPEIGCHYF
jgi:hypothetical protein